jgi:tetratricopeptide (TPR) repeat protein
MERAIIEGDRALYELAERKFDQAVTTALSDGMRWRATINLSIVLRRLGRAIEAVDRLKKIRSLSLDTSGSLNGPRRLNSLGSAYAEAALQHASQANTYRTKALSAYKQALKVLDQLASRKGLGCSQLQIKILSNLASTYIEAQQPDEAIEAARQALALLHAAEKDTSDWRLACARSQRVEAEALNFKADTYRLEENVTEIIQFREEALHILKRTRHDLLQDKEPADWNQITIILALSQRVLGYLLTSFGAGQKHLEGVTHLCETIQSLREATPYLAHRGLQGAVLEEVGITLRLLRPFVPPAPIASSAFESCCRILQIAGFPWLYGDILIEAACIIIPVFSHLLTLFQLLSDVAKKDQIKALADFIASFGLPEDEATVIVSAALERLGWSSRVILPRPERRDTVEHAAAEVSQRLVQSDDATGRSPMPPEARELFGDAPDIARPKIYMKSNFPPDWFDNIDIVRAARRIVTTYKNRDKSIPVESDAQERYRTANRFMKAYESRRRRARNPSPPITPR